MDQNKRLTALAQFLSVEESEIETISDDSFKYGREEYRVLTDSEADDAAKEYILESVWAFTPSFLVEHMPDGVEEDALKMMQEKLCESANATFRAMILDLDHFVSDAMAADGRGHFLSPYDGDENEQGELYIYRQN